MKSRIGQDTSLKKCMERRLPMLSKLIRKFLYTKNIKNQLMLYLAIGCFTALFELLLFTVFRKIFGFDIPLSNITAIVCATILNFSLNRGLAFKSASYLPRSIILYLLLFFLNMFISTSLIKHMVQVGIFDVVAKMVTMLLITTWNFLLYRKVIFR